MSLVSFSAPPNYNFKDLVDRKLLLTPLDDYRKFVVWRILAPYLINIRKCSADEASNIMREWLDRCRSLRQLDFSPNYIIKHDINSAKRGRYLPISQEKLKTENVIIDDKYVTIGHFRIGLHNLVKRVQYIFIDLSVPVLLPL